MFILERAGIGALVKSVPNQPSSLTIAWQCFQWSQIISVRRQFTDEGSKGNRIYKKTNTNYSSYMLKESFW